MTTFQQALQAEEPLRIPGTLFPFAALAAQQAGYKAVYLSGGGVANIMHGVPDDGTTTLQDVINLAKPIAQHKLINIPLLVDIDTGWDDPAETMREMDAAGVAAVHMEDQVEAKLCGHLEGKQLVSTEEMMARITAAKKGSEKVFLLARADGLAVEGLEATINRSIKYMEAGADGIFAEAMTDISHYRQLKDAIGDAPLLANITEYGKTEPYTPGELKEYGVDIVLWPRSAERAMLQNMMEALDCLAEHGKITPMIEQGKVMHRKAVNGIINYDAPMAEKLANA